MAIQIIQIPVLGDNYSYLIRDDKEGRTAVVDPAEAGPVLKRLDQEGWKLDYILNTHHHVDHVGGNRELKQATACRVVGSKAEVNLIPGIDIALGEPDRFVLGGTEVRIIDTPGHTVGHVCYYFEWSDVLFSGDHLFSMGCGRLFGGTAAQMWASLDKIRKLPKETQVYCAHEYTVQNGRFALTVEPGNPALQKRCRQASDLRAESKSTVPSTLQQELDTNPFLRPESAEIRAAIGKEDASDQQVFADLRQRKDRF